MNGLKCDLRFIRRDDPQKKAEMDFVFEDHGGTQIVAICLDKNRVFHQYSFGDKDLLKLQRKLNKHIKDHKVGRY